MAWSQNYRCNFPMEEWADEHGLIHQLLPMEHRENDPIQVLKTLREQFDKWPKTKATWKYAEIPEDNSAIRGCKEEGLLLPTFVGSYKVADANIKTRWSNPNYVHDHNLNVVTDMDRAEYIRGCALAGVITSRELEDRLPINRSTIQFVCKQDIGTRWKELRQRGQERIVRTVLTIAEWTDYTRTELSRVFGVPESTFRHWSKHVDFEPPEEPVLLA